MKNKYVFYIFLLSIFIIFLLPPTSFGAYPKLISTLNNAFEKVESWILAISTPAAAVAVGSGVLMKKFSFGDEERMRMGKKVIRSALFSYAFILCIDLILSTINTLLG